MNRLFPSLRRKHNLRCPYYHPKYCTVLGHSNGCSEHGIIKGSTKKTRDEEAEDILEGMIAEEVSKYCVAESEYIKSTYFIVNISEFCEYYLLHA